MSRVQSTVLVAGLAGLLVFASSARAGLTIDVVFRDATTPSGIVIDPSIPSGMGSLQGPGCLFSGYYGGSVSTGYCMDVMMYTDDEWIGVGISVQYDTDNGLAVAQMSEWIGFLAGSGKSTKNCSPAGGLVDNGGILQQFDCIIAPPNAPPQAAAGTYKLGTIIWDTSGLVAPGTETIAAVIAGGDGFIPVINGNITVIPPPPVLPSHTITIIPEPGTAALLGLGLVGLLLGARRRQAPGR